MLPLYLKAWLESFHWKVWNDFVNKVNEARIETGQAWKTEHASKAQALVEGIYSDLTVSSYNSVVQNIDYPFWNWAKLPGSPGYLGRLLMRGTATVGESADNVYYQYLLEIARKLNLVIGIYNNTGQLTPLASALNMALITLADLTSLPPRALQAAHTISLIAEAPVLQRPPRILSGILGPRLKYFWTTDFTASNSSQFSNSCTINSVNVLGCGFSKGAGGCFTEHSSVSSGTAGFHAYDLCVSIVDNPLRFRSTP